jgi:transcriptional regulator with XRE-family HTH domain
MGRPRRDNTTKPGKNARLARQLDELRHDKTLSDLRELTGLSIATLSKVTDPTRSPSWATMVKYLTALGEDPDEWRPQWEMCADEAQRRAAGLPTAPEQRSVYQRMHPHRILSQLDFGLALKELRLWRGKPTYAQIVSNALHEGLVISQTTISDIFTGKLLATEYALESILIGLGMKKTDAEYTVWFDVRRALEARRDRHKAEESTLPYAAMGRPRRSRAMHRRIRRKD